jgi:pimeloyl-ACP methyl ester carboxylesterase
MVPVTRYAKSGEVSIAYQVIGEGPPDLVLVPGFVSHVEAAWQWPYLARFLNRLGSIARLITFDKRGTGLSDPMTRPPSLDERMDDIRAVMDATGCERAPLLGVSEGGALSIKFASEHPERVAALVLYGSYAKKAQQRGLSLGREPGAAPAVPAQLRQRLGDGAMVGHREPRPRGRPGDPRGLGTLPAGIGESRDGEGPPGAEREARCPRPALDDRCPDARDPPQRRSVGGTRA